MNFYLILVLLFVFIFIFFSLFYNLFRSLFQKNDGGFDVSDFNFTFEKTNIIRGLAIYGIFISHIATHYTLYLSPNFIEKYVIYITVLLGDLGVAIFFFLSGYGNYISIDSRLKENSYKSINFWIVDRLKKMLLTFFVCYFIDLAVNVLLFKNILSIKDILIDLVTLSVPNVTTWYFKIQLLLYIITYLGVILLKSNKHLISFVFGFSLVYIIVMYKFKFGAFWWQNTMAYCIGMIFVRYKNQFSVLINKYGCKLVSIMSIVFSGIFFLFAEVIFSNNFIFRIIFMSLMILFLGISLLQINYKNSFWINIISWAGKASLSIYLIHAGIVEVCFVNKIVTIKNTVVFLALTIILSYLENKISKFITLQVKG